jgi:hypothetical protein
MGRTNEPVDPNPVDPKYGGCLFLNIVAASSCCNRDLPSRLQQEEPAGRYMNFISASMGRGTPPYIWFISPNVYATNSNWSYQAGPVLSFEALISDRFAQFQLQRPRGEIIMFAGLPSSRSRFPKSLPP